MKCQFILVVIVALTEAGLVRSREGEKADADDKELLGTWSVQEGEALGQKIPASEAGKMRLVFSKDKVIWQFDRADGERSHEGTYRAAPTKNPKEIDLTAPDTPKIKALAIYKLEGDTLTILMGRNTLLTRPKSFEDKALARLVFKKKSQ